MTLPQHTFAQMKLQNTEAKFHLVLVRVCVYEQGLPHVQKKPFTTLGESICFTKDALIPICSKGAQEMHASKNVWNKGVILRCIPVNVVSPLIMCTCTHVHMHTPSHTHTLTLTHTHPLTHTLTLTHSHREYGVQQSGWWTIQ